MSGALALRRRAAALLLLLSLLFAPACATTSDELRGVADQPPLDLSVLVTGGAFVFDAAGTFARPADDLAATGRREPLPFDAIADVLRRGRVFQRVAFDEDAGRRRLVRDLITRRAGEPDLARYLRDARARGFDLLLVVEELNDGPIDAQGTNGRWPVTFVTWILLGVGAFIPDRTFESQATLRVSLRELQTGRAVADLVLGPGPVELALTERTDALGLLMSVLVPPFWVGDDQESVVESVRATTERRLLLSLARDLKGQPMRQTLRQNAISRIEKVERGGATRIVVDSLEGVSVVQLLGDGVDDETSREFERRLTASRTSRGATLHYEADLPAGAGGGLVQVVVGTMSGVVSSATFAVGGER